MELSPAKQALLEKWLKGQRSGKSLPIIARRANQKEIKLSLPQRRQLFLELLEPGTAVNNLSVFVELRGPLDRIALEQSAGQILSRHEVLRTQFSFDDGTPVPEIVDDVKLEIPLVDLKEKEISESIKEAHRLAEKEVLKPFELSQAPFIRLKLFALEKQIHFLLVAVHHTISDGWSLGVFLKELLAFYEPNVKGIPVQLSELPIQYADYALWQTDEKQTELLDSSLAYWKEKLFGDLPTLELPTDHLRGPRQSFSGGTHRFTISKTLTASLETLSQEQDVTLFMTLLSGFKILLHRYSGQNDILVGTPIANRNLPELQPLIGTFINTLVLRTSLADNQTFLELLKQVRKVSTDAYSHQDFPFERLVEELKPKRDLSRTPLFQVVFNMQNSPLPKLETTDLKINFHEIDRGVSQFDMSLMISRINDECLATVEYNIELFKPETIIRMFQSYQILLEAALAQPNEHISELPIASQDDMDRLVYTLNQTQFDFPLDKCVHHLFEERVAETPNAVAIIYDETSLSYQELNNRSNAIANRLIELGVGNQVRVGIFMNRSLEMVQALLAVLKAGGTYIPLHTSIPTERLSFILSDAEVKVLLTNVDTKMGTDSRFHELKLNENLYSNNKEIPNLNRIVKPEQLAYIIFTSGSTGKPKGVMVNHSSLVNLLWSMKSQPGIIEKDVLMAVTAISFDIAALELFLPLIVGATVVIASEELIASPDLLGQGINRYQTSIMQATPATWQLLLKSDWEGKGDLKALCGGDVMTQELSAQLLERVDSLWNMYGPTETTIWSSVSQIHKNDTSITIGKPIANTQFYILDNYLKPVHYGVIGELHIGGAGLAQGYLNQPELTSQKFIPDIFNPHTDQKIYKTGDRARFLEDESIEILGRMDNQLKINGYRIELGEITEVLSQHPDIISAIAIARTERNGDKRLIGYFVSKQFGNPDSAELRNFVSRKLPHYMIPSLFVDLETMPLTPNGKVDYKKLPLPEDVRIQSGYEEPRTEEEKILVEVWQNILDVEQVGIHDNYFDLGGASIQSLQIVAKANMYGIPISIENLFEYQTIADLVSHIHK